MTSEQDGRIGIERIMGMLPHRYPFLLVDRVLSYEAGKYIEAVKNVTVNEPYFLGHFPGLPVMPGVLQLEAMAQAGGLLFVLSSPEPLDGKLFLFTGIEKARFRRPVTPGDQLLLRVEDFRQKMNFLKMSCTASVDGKVCAQGSLSAAIVERGGAA
jgi:3-hydroxyacyl-[acyl-carrier-protein] dehydratase